MTRTKRTVLAAVTFSALALGAVPTATAAATSAGTGSDSGSGSGSGSAHQLGKPKGCKKGNFCLRDANGKIMLSRSGNWSVGDDRAYWATTVENRGVTGGNDHIKVKGQLTNGPSNTYCLAPGKKHTTSAPVSILSVKWTASC